MSQAEYDAQTWPVPRRLIEAAIDALDEQAYHAEHWRGIRDYRIDQPAADSDELRAIVGSYEPVLSDEEVAERDAAVEAYMAGVHARIAERAASGS